MSDENTTKERASATLDPNEMLDTSYRNGERAQHCSSEAIQPDDDAPDWGRACEVCGERPVHPVTGMCGPCTFGEAETAGGAWYEEPRS